MAATRTLFAALTMVCGAAWDRGLQPALLVAARARLAQMLIIVRSSFGHPGRRRIFPPLRQIN
jgi:hypothetical protein